MKGTRVSQLDVFWYLKLFAVECEGRSPQLHVLEFVIYRHTSWSGERDAIYPSQCVNERKHCHPE